MTTFQLLCFVLITAAFTWRTFFMRGMSHRMKPEETALVMGLGSILSLPPLLVVLSLLGFDAHLENAFHWKVMLGGLAKGVGIYGSIVLGQMLIKRSMATASYSALMSVGFVALTNMLLWGERITLVQTLSISALTLLGTVFLVFGPIKELGNRARLMFALVLFLLTLFGSLDYVIISQFHWSAYFGWTALGMLIAPIVLHKRLYTHLSRSDFFRATVAWVVPEFILLSVIVTILPVSVVALAVAMRVPLNMIGAALLWKDGTVKEQALFSIAALLACLPLFFKW